MNFNNKRTWGPAPFYPKTLEYKYNNIGMNTIIGMCFVDEEYLKAFFDWLKKSKINPTFLRGGVFRAGTYPPQDFGFQKEIFKIYANMAHQQGYAIITEVLDIRQIEFIADYADALQVGARHCQDYALLKEVSQFNGCVAIKRGMYQTLDEFLGSVEYLLKCGKCMPLLIERGSTTFLNHVRWDLSLSIISAIKKINPHLPIIVDASHGTGRGDIVANMTYAGLSAGADGFLLECHPNPLQSISDSEQAVDLIEAENIFKKSQKLYDFLRKEKYYERS